MYVTYTIGYMHTWHGEVLFQNSTAMYVVKNSHKTVGFMSPFASECMWMVPGTEREEDK